MEKYTVDIDKVLDDFEESEALEEIQHRLRSNNSTQFGIIDEVLLHNENLHEQISESSTCNQSNLNNVNEETESIEEHVKISNIQQSSIFSAQLLSKQCDAFSETFHSSKNNTTQISCHEIPILDKNLQSKLCSTDSPISSSSKVPDTFTKLDPYYESSGNAMCSSLSNENASENNLYKSSLENLAVCGNIYLQKKAAKNSEEEQLHVDLHNNVTLSESVSDFFCRKQNCDVFPCDTTEASTTVASNNIHTQIQNITRQSVSSLDHLHDNKKMPHCDVPRITENINIVSFSECNEDSHLSLEDMNEYLNDIDQVQDEDSGVSSQEDINGNNGNADIFEKTVLSEGATSHSDIFETSSGKENCPDLCKTTCQTKENAYEDQIMSNKFDALMQKDVGSNNDDLNKYAENASSTKRSSKYKEVKLDSQLRDINLLNNECDITLTDKSIFYGNNINTLTSVDHPNQQINLQYSRLPSEAEQLLVDCHNSLPNQCDDHIYVDSSATDTPQMKLIFSPNEGTFRSVLSSEIPSKPDESKKKFSCSGNYDDTFEDTSSLFNNQSHNSKLQRPKSLNIPGRDVATANIVTSYINVPPSTEQCNSLVEIPPAPIASEILDTEIDVPLSKIGVIKPFWIPDSNASNCMHCGIKFTVIKRRHHCRACGKVLCSRCCNQKARLPYLLNKEDRVCLQCVQHLSINEAVQDNVGDDERGESPISSSCGSSPSFSPASASSNFQYMCSRRPHPNNPDDYCSTVSPFQQAQEFENRPPPTVMVPVGVLKRGNKPRGEPKQVIFSDGIRPGGDLTDVLESTDVLPYQRQDKCVENFSIIAGNEASQYNLRSSYLMYKNKIPAHNNHHRRVVVSDADGPLPPVLLPHDYEIEENIDISTLFTLLQDEETGPVVFAVTKNVHVLAKVLKLDCCYGKECWSFTSHGLCTVGQDEVVLLIERFQDEDVIPRDVFKLYNEIYEDASKGITIGELGHLIFPDGIFGNWEHRGFLFIRPTFQCLSKLVLPNSPYLFAILILKWEVPWAKVFPLRLMLRLGAECRYYPCSLVSVRFRKPVYFEIGQTIMSLLADLRNFQFTIPFVPGLVVHMEEKKTFVNIPKNRYDKLMKVLQSNNVEHVLALGCNFSTEADSHLVCMQKDGDYQAQAINIEHTTRQVTGASFIVFSEALKSATGLSAKFKIVEDGLLVEIPQETMSLLHCALKDMHDLTIQCGHINDPEPEEIVVVQWTSDDKKVNVGVISPVDKRSLEGISSLRIHTSTDYAGDTYLIRWTEVFFLEVDKNINKKRADTVDPCRLAENVAQSFCMALIPYLDALVEANMTKIGLRITLDSKKDMVEYDVGSIGHNLPSIYMNALDSSLIPVLSRITLASQENPTALELIFFILAK